MLVTLTIVGTVGFVWFEEWSPLEALYTTIITATTVGYGDFTPTSPASRVFTTLFAASAVGIAGYTLSVIAASVIEREQARAERKMRERKMKQIEKLNNHIIVCGGGQIGGQVAREFQRTKTPFIFIEGDETTLRWSLFYLQEELRQEKVEQYREMGFITTDDFHPEEMNLPQLAEDADVIYLLEDPTEDGTLYKAGIERARSLVTVLEDDRDNLFVTLSARQLATRLDNQKLQIVSRLTNEKNATKLKAAGADRIVSLGQMAGTQIANIILHPDVADFFLHTYYSDRYIRFASKNVMDAPEFIGKTLGQMKEEHDKLIIAIQRNGEYLYTPPLSTTLEQDDVLIEIVVNQYPASDKQN
jgi:voltage-gated potassium channel